MMFVVKEMPANGMIVQDHHFINQQEGIPKMVHPFVYNRKYRGTSSKQYS
jgi:hypothetical protein